jgi:hypothetical protein
MSNKRKAEKQVADFETFQKVFIESERVMRENLEKLIQSKLDKETNFDARMAYKIAIKIIRTGTLNDVSDLDLHADSVDVDGNESESQSKGGNL